MTVKEVKIYFEIRKTTIPEDKKHISELFSLLNEFGNFSKYKL